MVRSKVFLVVPTLLALAASPAFADDPKFAYGDKTKDVKDVKGTQWTATAEGGVVLTTGNSETTTATGGFHVTRKTGNNKLSAEGSVAYAKSAIKTLNDKNGNMLIDGEDELVTIDTLTAETIQSKIRYDRYLTDLNSVYVSAQYLRDQPAGKDYVVGGQVGYSRSLEKSKTGSTVAEIGYDFSHEQAVAPPGMDAPAGIEIHSIRAFLGTKQQLTLGSDFEANIEALSNLNRETLSTKEDGGAFEDTRVNGKIAISAKIGKSVAAQTSLEFHYDHRPSALPLKGLAPDVVIVAAPMDTIMKLQIIYTFF
jgi:hypothetical protein